MSAGEEYVVEIKPSARRTNGAVGEAVNRSGARHRFESRAHAEVWAVGLASRGGSTVWIREANPNDERGVDAYLMGRQRPVAHGSGGEDPGDQSAVLEYGRDGER